jgi:hypothetical protein
VGSSRKRISPLRHKIIAGNEDSSTSVDLEIRYPESP